MSQPNLVVLTDIPEGPEFTGYRLFLVQSIAIASQGRYELFSFDDNSHTVNMLIGDETKFLLYIHDRLISYCVLNLLAPPPKIPHYA